MDGATLKSIVLVPLIASFMPFAIGISALDSIPASSASKSNSTSQNQKLQVPYFASGSLFEKLLKAFPKKDPFESTTNYQTRITSKLLKALPSERVALIADPPRVTYDADAEVVNLATALVTEESAWGIEKKILLSKAIVPTGSYVGSNAFGTKVLVRKRDINLYHLGLYSDFSTAIPSSGGFDYLNVNFPLKRALAREVAANLRILVEIDVVQPIVFSVELTQVYTPTRQNPYENKIWVYTLGGVLRKIIVFDIRSRKIWHVVGATTKEPANAPSETHMATEEKLKIASVASKVAALAVKRSHQELSGDVPRMADLTAKLCTRHWEEAARKLESEGIKALPYLTAALIVFEDLNDAAIEGSGRIPQLLQDHGPDFRTVRDLISKIGPEALPHLMSWFDGSIEGSEAVILAVGELGKAVDGQRAAEQLLNSLDQSKRPLKLAMITCVGHLAETGLLSPSVRELAFVKLIEQLSPNDGSIQEVTVVSLGQLRDKRAIAYLEKLAPGSDEYLSSLIKDAIKKIESGSMFDIGTFH